MINALKFNQLVNRNIRDDPQQLQAVNSILEQPKSSVPFIIYGPLRVPRTLLWSYLVLMTPLQTWDGQDVHNCRNHHAACAP